jgi:hypothetical protein
MKLYDYAARGRPIVSTRWSDRLAAEDPPRPHLADTPDEFAAAVLSADQEPAERARSRRAWAEGQTWERRWDSWSTAVFGA